MSLVFSIDRIWKVFFFVSYEYCLLIFLFIWVIGGFVDFDFIVVEWVYAISFDEWVESKVIRVIFRLKYLIVNLSFFEFFLFFGMVISDV